MQKGIRTDSHAFYFRIDLCSKQKFLNHRPTPIIKTNQGIRPPACINLTAKDLRSVKYVCMLPPGSKKATDRKMRLLLRQFLAASIICLMAGCAAGPGYYGEADEPGAPGPDVFLWGGVYDNWHDVHHFSHRGRESHWAAHHEEGHSHGAWHGGHGHTGGSHGGRR